MILDFQQIEELFVELDKALETPVKVYLIGGAALMHYGSKDSTKDIDIVVRSSDEYNKLRDALSQLKFSSSAPPHTHKKFAIETQFVRGDFRIDLFNTCICGKLSVTESVAGKSVLLKDFGKLTILVCSPGDIFLFKSITERPGDKDDCINLAKQGIDWKSFFEELVAQTQDSDKEIWITDVCGRLQEIEELGITIPILPQVTALAENYLLKFSEEIESKSNQNQE